MRRTLLEPMKVSLRSLLSAGRVFAALGLSFGAGAAISVAQPSGGPYGPVQLRYEIPAANHVYYVAPDGRADASGASIKQPTTLETAIDKVVTGDAIVLRGGVYRTGGLRLNQGVTLQPYADERPILKGTEVATQWEALPNGHWRTKWEHLFPAAPADWWRAERFQKETPLHLFNNDMVFFDGELLGAVGSEADVTEKTYFIDYPHAQVIVGRNPENSVVEITAHDDALVRTYRDVHGKQNDHKGAVIRGLTFTQYAYRALEVEGVEPQKHADPATFGKDVVGSVFENVTISFCSRVAGYFRGDNMVFRHCLIADCGTEGVYVIDSADLLFEKNIVTRTNSAERIMGYYASAVKIFNQSYRAVVRDNLIIDNPNASGVWFDVGEVDAVFVSNWVERTNDGFFFEISKGAICAGNVFVDCTPGTRVLNSSKVQLYQNTYYNSAAWIRRDDRSAVGDHFGWHPSAGPDVTERHSHVFANNLLVADVGFKGALLQFSQGEKVKAQLKDPQVSTLDGNVYVRRAGPKPQPLLTWSPTQTEKGSDDIFDLAELTKQQPKFETSSKAWSDYWGPLVRSPELHHFELQPGFPGAQVGIPLPDPVRTLLNWPVNTPPFPGAYPPAR